MAALTLAAAPAGMAQSLDLSVAPVLDLPLGDSSGRFTMGGGAELAGGYALPPLPWLRLSGDIGYRLLPTAAGASLSAISLSAGAGLVLEPLPRLQASIDARGGAYYGIYKGLGAANALARADAGLAFSLSRALKLGAGASFLCFLASPKPTYTGLSLRLVATYVPGGGGNASRLGIDELRLEPVFPVFFKYYDTNPVGSVVIANRESSPIRDVRVSLYAKEFMDAPKVCAEIPSMRKGERREVPLLALFGDQILSVTESTKVSVEVRVDYALPEGPMSAARSESLRVLDRNSMIWEDDRRAAAFVTPKDPAVLELSKAVAGLVREDPRAGGSLDFRIALGLFQALGTYGMKYVRDPKSSYVERSANPREIDFLQFPRQSLQYKSGDCDDLSILYAALLESVGVETAFITVPGHIYAAAALGMDAAEAARYFSRVDQFVAIGGKVYVPVETTMYPEGFLAAWATGAKEWRDAGERAKLLPIREAWQVYEAVGLRDSPPALALPGPAACLSAYGREIDRFVAQELEPRVRALKAEMAASNNAAESRNKLAVLYARYGQYDQAEPVLQGIVASAEYAPALVNLGNIALIRRDPAKAGAWFERAMAAAPGNAQAIAGRARSSFELGEASRAAELFARLQSVDPVMAARYSYLASAAPDGSKASAVTDEVKVDWSEEARP